MRMLLKYVLSGLKQRKTINLLTVSSFTLVLATLMALLALAQGIEETLVVSGSDDRFFAISNKANTESQSRMDDSDPASIGAFDEVKIDAEGLPLISFEIVTTATLGEQTGDIFPQIVRGVDLNRALQVHDGVHLIEGKWFNEEAANEVIAGRGAQKLLGIRLNDNLKLRGGLWRVTGIFADDGSPAESEIWTSRQNLEIAFNKDHVSSVWGKVKSPRLIESFVKKLNRETRVQVYAMTEKEYFRRGASTAQFYRAIAWFVTVLLSLGAIFSAMNTMAASLSNRTRELATLRALGFRTNVVMATAIFEAIVLAVAGGLGASVIMVFVNGSAMTMTVPGLGKVVYSVTVTGGIFAIGMFMSLLLGALSGWLPARKAVKLSVVTALKS